MTHTVCGTPVTFRYQDVPHRIGQLRCEGSDLTGLRESIPVCPACGIDVPLEELA